MTPGTPDRASDDVTGDRCDYCRAAATTVPVTSSCPEHGPVREAMACLACIPNPNCGARNYVHMVGACDQRVVLEPK